VLVAPVDHPADRGEALRAHVLGQPLEKRAPDPLPATPIGDERHDAPVTQVGLAGEAGADELAAAVGE
jgi:hypothetical protein